MQWCALVRSVLEIEKQHGWKKAGDYLTRQLTAKVRERMPFGEYSPLILNSVLTVDQTAATTPSSGASSHRGIEFCNSFNTKGASCRFNPCLRKHGCNFPNCPNPMSHARFDCPLMATRSQNKTMGDRHNRFSRHNHDRSDNSGSHGKKPISVIPKLEKGGDHSTPRLSLR